MTKKKLLALALLGLYGSTALFADCNCSQNILAIASQKSAIADEDEDNDNENHEEDERGAYRGGERNFGENRGFNRGNASELNRGQENRNRSNGDTGIVNEYPTQP